MCSRANGTVVMVAIIIVMMKGYYKNTGHEEKQCQPYKTSATSLAQHVFSLLQSLYPGPIFII